MSKLRVENFMISVDGFGAALGQSHDNPFGVGGMVLGQAFVKTKTFQSMFGKDEGSTGVDNQFAARGFVNIGANIMGRNMFGPQRGPWADESWKGWWAKPALSFACVRHDKLSAFNFAHGRRNRF